MNRFFSAGLFLLFIFSECSSSPDIPESGSEKIEIYESSRFDKFGLVVFSDKLKDKKESKDGKYVIVYSENDKPVKSFQVLTSFGAEINLAKPFQVILRWTGSGFEAGVGAVGGLRIGTSCNSSDCSAVAAIILVSPVIIGTFVGFVIGVIDSIPTAAKEIAKIFDRDKEIIFSYSIYEYDDKNRLKSYSIFAPGQENRLVAKGEFFYKGNELYPSKDSYYAFQANGKREVFKKK